MDAAAVHSVWQDNFKAESDILRSVAHARHVALILTCNTPAAPSPAEAGPFEQLTAEQRYRGAQGERRRAQGHQVGLAIRTGDGGGRRSSSSQPERLRRRQPGLATPVGRQVHRAPAMRARGVDFARGCRAAASIGTGYGVAALGLRPDPAGAAVVVGDVRCRLPRGLRRQVAHRKGSSSRPARRLHAAGGLHLRAPRLRRQEDREGA